MNSEEKSMYVLLNSSIGHTLRHMLPRIVEATGSNLTIGTLAIWASILEGFHFGPYLHVVVVYLQ